MNVFPIQLIGREAQDCAGNRAKARGKRLINKPRRKDFPDHEVPSEMEDRDHVCEQTHRLNSRETESAGKQNEY